MLTLLLLVVLCCLKPFLVVAMTSPSVNVDGPLLIAPVPEGLDDRSAVFRPISPFLLAFEPLITHDLFVTVECSDQGKRLFAGFRLGILRLIKLPPAMVPAIRVDRTVGGPGVGRIGFVAVG